jgi:hypothetical protein
MIFNAVGAAAPSGRHRRSGQGCPALEHFSADYSIGKGLWTRSWTASASTGLQGSMIYGAVGGGTGSGMGCRSMRGRAARPPRLRA